ncbi:hypothetical protein C496_19870 [Natronorubrum tibetense GA33]|uniref:Uncharacterized protein n=1 Tax=Natronorubrum tibetense GA33 TaxID=1114856 RepID=L9VKW7_9EURY|nr:hypothetical protein C496_19870 [Natronorubrum tibetense GA33]
MFFVSKSEPRSAECSLKMFCSINEKHSIVEVMFLSEFLQELFCQSGRSRRIQPCMEYLVSFWIDSSVQPIAVFVKLNHRFVKRDVIRILVNCRL